MVSFGFIKSRKFNEMVGICLFMVGILISVSIYSFYPNDPYFNSLDFNFKGQHYKNFAGLLGASLTRYLLENLGFGIFLFTAVIFLYSIFYLFGSRDKIFLLRFLGVILIFFSISIILTLVWKNTYYKDFPITGGVKFGNFLVNSLTSYLNHVGTWILSFTLTLIGFLLLTDISLSKAIKNTFLFPLTAFKKIGKIKILGDSTGSEFSLNKNLESISDQKVTKVKMKKISRIKKGKIKSKNNGQLNLFSNLPESYQPPTHKIFDPPKNYKKIEYEQENFENAEKIVKKLKDFGINGKIVSYMRGPVVTRFEYKPSPGVKVSKIIGASEDLALALHTKIPPRIAHVPGKGVIGVEIPNEFREEVNFLQIISSDEYTNNKSALKIALGVDISGSPFITDLARMPHLLIAGATGTGKSVCINAVLCSLLVNAPPDELRLLLIDPKMLELSLFNGLPHLREEVITDYKKAAVALEWAIEEMNERYKTIAAKNVRNIQQYNELVDNLAQKNQSNDKNSDEIPKKMPYYVIIIDELADLMLAPGTNIDESITRLAQMARASGIHLVLATQRPSVDVVTGIIKANFPCRVSFQVSSKVDSRTILDSNGAEKLLGFGDMLFIPPGTSALQRLHGAYVSENEVKKLVKYLKSNEKKISEDSIFKIYEQNQDTKQNDFSAQDELYQRAVELVVSTRMASVSMLQRKLKVGHSRAARLVDMMEEDGIVGPFEGSKTREVLVDKNFLAFKGD